MPIKGLGPPILMSEVIRVGSGVQVLRQSLVSIFILVYA